MNCSKPKLTAKKNYTELKIKNDILTNKEPNNNCLLKNGTYIKINEIFELNDEIVMKAQCFNSVRSFFEEPIDSRILGIHLCSLENESIICCVKDIVCKVMVSQMKIYLLFYQSVIILNSILKFNSSSGPVGTLVCF